MTREEVMRAGGVFRSDVQKAPHDIRKGDGVRKRGAYAYYDPTSTPTETSPARAAASA